MQSNPGWWKVSHPPDAELSLWINCGMGNKYARTDTGARRTAKIEEVSDPFETSHTGSHKGNWTWWWWLARHNSNNNADPVVIGSWLRATEYHCSISACARTTLLECGLSSDYVGFNFGILLTKLSDSTLYHMVRCARVLIGYNCKNSCCLYYLRENSK